MKRIELKDMHFKYLMKINSRYNSESTLYHDKKTAYKLFKTNDKRILIPKERKIELLSDGNRLPNVIMPIDKIYDKFNFEGYTMKYISDSTQLYSIKKIDNDYQLLLQILLTVSKTLKTIHSDPRKIVVGDLNFHNIIIDKKFNPYFVDFDSCKIDCLKNENISAILGDYLISRGQPINRTNKNSDKLSLILSFLDIIFEQNIRILSIRQYDKLATQLTTLKNMRSLVLEIKNTNHIPTVPYLHELISDKDIKTKKRI